MSEYIKIIRQVDSVYEKYKFEVDLKTFGILVKNILQIEYRNSESKSLETLPMVAKKYLDDIFKKG